MNGLKVSLTAALPFTVLLLVGTAVAAEVGAQEPSRSSGTPSELADRNALYLELLGNGGLYSVNYERRMKDRIALRVGVGTWDSTDLLSDSQKDERILAFPMTVSLIRGGRHGGFEVGGGLLTGRETSDLGSSRNILALTGIVGYRRSPADSQSVLRISLTPFLDLTGNDDAYPDKGFFPSAGLSVGRVF
jgi:hypothetical protein